MLQAPARAGQAPRDMNLDPSVAVAHRGVAGVSRGGSTHNALPSREGQAGLLGRRVSERQAFTIPQAYAAPVDA